MARGTRMRTFHEFDGGDVRRVRVIAQPHPDGEHIAVRVTYMGEEGGRAPLEEVTVRHHRDRVYELPFRLGLDAALVEGLRMWREDVK